MTRAELSAKLKNYKIENKLTYEVLAEKIGTTKHICYDVCSDRRVFIPLEVAQAIILLTSEA